MNDAELKKIILDSFQDAAKDVMHYGRKEDEELPLGAIEDAVHRGVVTTGELVEHFGQAVREFMSGRWPS